ncbi:MAG TPA: amino acid ABC transporter ATP-binding protein [Spirochaetia bacterium]|nr:amino acid ABC transporter ATP-binding protein [Spirochaetia bacterium]
MNMVELIGIEKRFGNLLAVNNVSLTVSKGEVVSIIGPSGSGKSTLLRCINQLERMDSGIVSIEGIPISAEGNDKKKVHIDERLTKEGLKKLGMVFQHFFLFPHMTVLENVIEAPIIVNKMKKSAAIEAALPILDDVGLLDKKDEYPARLSGGQKQRVAIARALCMKPDVLLCDEPTSALDPELVGEVLAVLRRLAEKRMTMLIVTHEMAFAREVSARVLFMDSGSIIEDDPPSKMFSNPDHPRIREFIGKMI